MTHKRRQTKLQHRASLLLPQTRGGLVQQDAANADGERNIIIGGEGNAHVNAALGLLRLAAQLGGLQLHDEGARSLAAKEDASGSTAKAVLPVASEAFLHVPRAALAAACSGHEQLVNGGNGFLQDKFNRNQNQEAKILFNETTSTHTWGNVDGHVCKVL